MSRRRFFKKAVKEILPMLGAFVAAPSFIMNTLTSCGDVCDGCEAACRDNCVDSCKGACYESCSGSSTGGGCSDCSSSCSNSSTSNICTNCANDCTSSCNNTCKDECKESCLESCKDSCNTSCSSSCEGSAIGKPTTGSINGHEYVDMGLSVLWATCNIGAKKEDYYGDYIAFARPTADQIDADTDYMLSYYKALNLKAEENISGTHLDAAKSIWGSQWRLPSKEEFQELIDNCNLEKSYSQSYERYWIKFVSKINGKSIVLPCPGWYTYENDVQEDGVRGYYWSGDVASVVNGKPKAVTLKVYTSSSKSIALLHDKWGYQFSSVRPVSSRENGNVATCNGTCTANCSSDCSSTCKGGCGKDCSGSCKEGCSTSCWTTCYSSCSEGCTATCADSCKAQTSQYCSNCASNCSSGCTTTCADACKAQTSQGCSNCATQCSGDCNHECTYGCGRQCYTSCGGQCKGKCGGSCQVECTSYAKNTPCASCGGTCMSACNENCTYDCYSTCKSIGYK